LTSHKRHYTITASSKTEYQLSYAPRAQTSSGPQNDDTEKVELIARFFVFYMPLFTKMDMSLSRAPRDL